MENSKLKAMLERNREVHAGAISRFEGILADPAREADMTVAKLELKQLKRKLAKILGEIAKLP